MFLIFSNYLYPLFTRMYIIIRKNIESFLSFLFFHSIILLSLSKSLFFLLLFIYFLFFFERKEEEKIKNNFHSNFRMHFRTFGKNRKSIKKNKSSKTKKKNALNKTERRMFKNIPFLCF